MGLTAFARAINGTTDKRKDIADKLCCSQRNLQRYIAGELMLPCSIIAAAAREYGSYEYALQHLLYECPGTALFLTNSARQIISMVADYVRHKWHKKITALKRAV